MAMITSSLYNIYSLIAGTAAKSAVPFRGRCPGPIQCPNGLALILQRPIRRRSASSGPEAPTTAAHCSSTHGPACAGQLQLPCVAQGIGRSTHHCFRYRSIRAGCRRPIMMPGQRQDHPVCGARAVSGFLDSLVL